MNMESFGRLALVYGEFAKFLVEVDSERRKRRILAQRMVVNANTLFFKRLLKTRHTGKPRSIWSKYRTSCWWTDVVQKTFNDRDWINNFRVDRDTFYQICDMVRENLKPKPTKLKPREPISVEKRVAIALYKFASCAEYRVIGNNMGVCILLLIFHYFDTIELFFIFR